MRHRTPLAVAALALAGVLVALAGPAALAEPPDPNHVVIQTLGRRVFSYAPYGDHSRGEAVCSAQGELVDTNNNGLANAIRGRGACLEHFGVDGFRMYSINLQRLRADVWVTVASDTEDAVAASYLVNYTPAVGYCVGNREVVQYRVQHTDAIRWSIGVVGIRNTVSATFEARMVGTDPDCPDLP